MKAQRDCTTVKSAVQDQTGFLSGGALHVSSIDCDYKKDHCMVGCFCDWVICHYVYKAKLKAILDIGKMSFYNITLKKIHVCLSHPAIANYLNISKSIIFAWMCDIRETSFLASHTL